MSNRERVRRYQQTPKGKAAHARYWRSEKGRLARKRIRNPERNNARQKLEYAVKMGRVIKPLQCEGCERETKLFGHHKDYAKPYEVQWLCGMCHYHLHHKEEA